MVKQYIVDTNVFISDPDAIETLSDNNTNKVSIPLSVLLELDNLKNDKKIGHLVRRSIDNIIKANENGIIDFIGFKDESIKKIDIPDGKILNEILSSFPNLPIQDKSVESIFVTNDKSFGLLMNISKSVNNVNLQIESYESKKEYISDPKLFTGVLKSNTPEENQINAKVFYTWEEGKLINYIDGTSRIVPDHEVWKVKPKHWTQNIGFDLLMNPDIHLVTMQGTSGFGKAQPLDSKILTPTGWIEMKDIKVGDVISCPDNSTSKVTGVFPQGKIPVYEVIFNDGTKTKCCENHLWKIRKNTSKKYNIIPLKHMINDLYYETNNGEKRIKNFSIPLQCAYMEENKVPIDPYLLGVIIGDGCSRNGITITTKDIEIIEECTKILPDNVKIKKQNSSKYIYGIVNKNYSWKNPNLLKKLLENLGIDKKLSYEKFIPKQYLFNSKENRISLLQGLMDTDGYISNNINVKSKEISFCTTSINLRDNFIDLVRSLGGKAKYYEKNSTYKYKNKKTNGRISWNIYINLPSDIIPFRLKRKINRYKTIKKYPISKGIKDIKLIGNIESQCISIDHPDRLYITDDFIVTHNTFITLAAALQLVLQEKLYKKIVFVKPMVTIGKELGYLPGNVDEKIEPYNIYVKQLLRKLHGNRKANRIYEVDDNVGNEKNINFNKLNENVFQFLPLNFIRGMNIDNAFVIIDEVQNLNQHELKSILTRMGENTKCICIGDVKQIDNPTLNEHNNGLSLLVRNLITDPNYGHVVIGGKFSRGPVCDMILNSGI